MTQIEAKLTLPNVTIRNPRIGINTRNLSHDIFQFGGINQDYQNSFERFETKKLIELDKEAIIKKKEKIKSDNEFKQHWMRDIEKNRWEKMEKGDKKEQEIWNYKHLKTKINKTSLEYNPITLEYYKSQGGEKLEQTDALSTHRTSVRAAKLYYKNNTFDPIKGLDINIKESKKKISISNQPEEKHPNFNQKTMEGEDEKKKNCLGKKLLTETSKTSLNLQRLNSHLVSNKKQKEIIENFPNSKFVNGLYDIDQDKFNTYWARRF